MQLPIRTMTTAEKLDVMEQIWTSLQLDPDIAPPDWHQEILAERKRRIENGETSFSTLEEVRERLSRHRN